MRGISREVLARHSAWTLADGACKDLTTTWSTWEQSYAAAITTAARAATLTEPAAVCDGCPISAECADLAQLSGYTGIAGGRAFRNGRPDRLAPPAPPTRSGQRDLGPALPHGASRRRRRGARPAGP